MKNFIEEVELKLQKMVHYQSMLNLKDINPDSGVDYEKLINEISEWLHEEVKCDLPTYHNRLSYYNYLKEREDCNIIIVDKSETDKFIEEVEEKVELRKKYKIEMTKHPVNSEEYGRLNKLQKEIKEWLKEEVDLDLPVYFDRLSYASYLKSQREKAQIPVSKEDNIILSPYNPGLQQKLYECMWETDKTYKLHADRIQNMNDVIAVFKLLDIQVAKIDLIKSGIDSEILERLFGYKGE